MNIIANIKAIIINETQKLFTPQKEVFKFLEFKINFDSNNNFGDLSSNIAMIIAKTVGENPRTIATKLKEQLDSLNILHIASISIAGPGFLNIVFSETGWNNLLFNLYNQKKFFFIETSETKKLNYLIEFVSANPTGPLHLGHGRGGIIGDVLARVLTFLGHRVHKEFYINDAGNQIKLLGKSLKIRCEQEIGTITDLPDGGYVGQYLIEIAKNCIQNYGTECLKNNDAFFENYAKDSLLKQIKQDLSTYNIEFDTWFSEKLLHNNGLIDKVLTTLIEKKLAYIHEQALWFKSSDFGDDKDRVIKKSNGELTYIAADIAYHKNKFDRGFDIIIDILGHDHHGYVNRLKATMEALGYHSENLHVILYQLVNIKNAGAIVKMSKRAGTFTQLSDVIEAVGVDVSRFFYLNRKADSLLDFDMDIALKKTEENPVYYIQYAYVRINSLIQKAKDAGFCSFIESIQKSKITNKDCTKLASLLDKSDQNLIKKIISLIETLTSISTSYHSNSLALYAHELAQCFHTYYTKNKIIDTVNKETSHVRIFLVIITHQTLDLCLDLLGLSKPERM